MLSLEQIAATVGEPNEHPLARKVWHRLAMQKWREDWRRAEAEKDWWTLDYLDRQYEKIQGV